MNTFLYRDCPDPGCNCCLSLSHRLSGGCFRTLCPSDNPTGENLGGLNRVSVARTHCHTFLVLSRSSNRCLSHNRVLLEVLGVVPSCWHHCSSLVMVLRRPSAAQNFPSTTRCTTQCSQWRTVRFHPRTSRMDRWCRVSKKPPTLCTKDRVYENNPQTIGNLKTAIIARIRAIPLEEYVRVIDNFAGAPLATVPATPRGSFGTHFGENIKVGLFDLQTGRFVEWPCTNWSYCAPNMKYFAETK